MINGLVKQYGLTPVLRGVSFEVSAGECVGMVGANGAGKSTLLRIVATLLQPTHGEVKVGGWPLHTHADRVRQHLGLISHQPMLYSDLTAEENLMLFARLYGLKDAKARVRVLLKQVGLQARQRDPVGTFSRGMWQRLTIARATLHEPDVLLLDEPYTGLDQAGSQLLDTLLQQERAQGRTILMITHDLARGYSLCDRMLVLHKGKIAGEVNCASTSQTEFVTQYGEWTGGGG